ncbi:MAG TPA: hypothetical protein EYP76_01785 [Thiomicrorhabdus sp.]|nr:hypothetical protein [Thiomicrorhabdus sp.]
MIKTIQFPIKGTFYYAAEFAIETECLTRNSPLILKPEPDNPYDPHAIQIYSPIFGPPETPSKAKLLLGYVPRALAKQLFPSIQAGIQHHVSIIHFAQKGKQIEIDCQLQLHLSWLLTLKIQLICFWIKQQQTLKKLKNRFKT